MEKHSLVFPLYVKIPLILLGISLVFGFLYIAQGILIPFVLALLISILLEPIVNFLIRRFRFPNVVAVLVSVILFLLLIGALLFFIARQVADFANDWPQIQQNLILNYENARQWIQEHLGVSYAEQKQYFKNITKESLNSGNRIVGSTLTSFTGFALKLSLMPIYIFFILFYRNLLINFLFKLSGSRYDSTVTDILSHIKTVTQHYITGLLIDIVVVSVLTTIGFMIVGIKHPILFGTITGVLNLIPYLGILSAAIITITATIIDSSEISMVVGIVIVNSVVQFLENNFLAPRIVGSQVRINALVSIVGVVAGGAVAGIAGMFMAIPLIGILKIIFDRIGPLQPWGFLIGDNSSRKPHTKSPSRILKFFGFLRRKI